MPHRYSATPLSYYPPTGSTSAPSPPVIAIQGPPGYKPYFQDISQHPHPAMQPHPVSSYDIRGQDPLYLDMSSTQALAKSFGVPAAIVSDLELELDIADWEDLAVGASGLSSGRDRDIAVQPPRDTTKWVSVSMLRAGPLSGSAAPSESVAVWLPKDRSMVRHITEAYFTRLNFHRPVFSRKDFESTLNDLYDEKPIPHDPGFICSAYLVLALGTLSELNHRASDLEKDGHQMNVSSPTAPKKLMPGSWPDHEEIFERALAVKPDLRVTISSLQALILLQWYLYTEQQGRTLWRLVGNLVRLAIELGLHHDPTSQHSTFSEEECQLRIRLWGIVLLHDRGTSILLGRPLAIAPSDANTPRPSRGESTANEISEHFVLSAPIAEIQADIIKSLYAPTAQNASSIMRHATRIIKSIGEFRKQLPENYQWFFSGTENWSAERRTKLVQDITEDQGLTLLKIGITRILLLRALFSSKELSYTQRYCALVDAVVTSHNIIIVHNQVVRYPDTVFFVSPIPLHIAAMVILYGHMSRCQCLTQQVALEDVWMALDMLPSFRWRWERRDGHGGHPLIAKLAERILGVNLHQVAPMTAPMLLSEHDWDTVGPPTPPQQNMQPSTPSGLLQYHGTGPLSYGSRMPMGAAVKRSPQHDSLPGTSPAQELPAVPKALFYPFYPDEHAAGAAMAVAVDGNAADYGPLLEGVMRPMGLYEYQQPQGSYMLEEKDAHVRSGGDSAILY